MFGKLRLVCFGTLLGLLLLEGALQLRARFVTALTVNEVIPDERLAYRPNPNYPGHDARGWHNSSALMRAEIVVFGDSQTYGVNLPAEVATEAAWPQRVGAILHRTVYQMAFGGYGPAQYVLLFEEALALEPKVIIAAYYYGDDMFNSYWFVYRIGDLRRSALEPVLDSSFASTDLKSRQAISRAETIDPGLLRRIYLDCREPVQVPDPRLQNVHDVLALPPLAPLRNEGQLQRARSYLTRNSALFRILEKRLFPTVQVQTKAEDYWPQLCVRYRDRDLTTIFNPGYRLVTLDYTDPRAVEGERITFLAFQYIAERCRQLDCRFYVAMIPTKETAFLARTHASLRDQTYMVDLWNAEARARTNALAFFAHEGIATIDTLPALEALIASGVNPYREDADGHPVQAGYDAIARAVAERLERDGVWR